MKTFTQREIKAAYAAAAAGEQALHLCDAAFVGPGAPLVFRRAKQFAHLFDQDYDRLVKTARDLGVRVIVPQHCGTHRQHVDLCGKPLERAIARAANEHEMSKRAAALVQQLERDCLIGLDVETLLGRAIT